MPLLRYATPAAALGGLLASDDSEAGYLTAGVRGARDKIGFEPSAETYKHPVIEGSPEEQQRALKWLVNRIRTAKNDGQKRGAVRDFVHDKTTYDKWAEQATLMDNAYAGPTYKGGLDAMLEQVVDEYPSTNHAVMKLYAPSRLDRAEQPLRGRLKREQPKGVAAGRYVDDSGKTKVKRASLGVAPANDSLLGLQVANRENMIADGRAQLGIERDPMYDYGSLLPVKTNIVTGERSAAVPDAAAGVLEGLLGLAAAFKTGVYDPTDILDVAL